MTGSRQEGYKYVKKPDFSISQSYSVQIEHHQNLYPELQVLQGQQALPTMCEICLEVQLSDMTALQWK